MGGGQISMLRLHGSGKKIAEHSAITASWLQVLLADADALDRKYVAV
jgi:hypothetical protein